MSRISYGILGEQTESLLHGPSAEPEDDGDIIRTRLRDNFSFDEDGDEDRVGLLYLLALTCSLGG